MGVRIADSAVPSPVRVGDVVASVPSAPLCQLVGRGTVSSVSDHVRDLGDWIYGVADSAGRVVTVFGSDVVTIGRCA